MRFSCGCERTPEDGWVRCERHLREALKSFEVRRPDHRMRWARKYRRRLLRGYLEELRGLAVEYGWADLSPDERMLLDRKALRVCTRALRTAEWLFVEATHRGDEPARQQALRWWQQAAVFAGTRQGTAWQDVLR